MRRAAFWLTVAFIFSVPWEAAIQVGTIGRVSRALGLVAAAVWVVSVVLRGRLRQPDAFVKAYFLFLIWNGLTLYWAIDGTAAFKGFVTYTQIFGMILILWDLFETEQQIEQALQAFVLGAYVSCVSIIVNFVTAPPTRFPEHQRIKALGFEVDGIALLAALAIPAAWYLAMGPLQRRGSNAIRAVNFFYVPLALFSIIATGTRGAGLATIPAMMFILWTFRSATPGRRFVALVTVAVAVVAVVSLAPRAPLERITGSVGDVATGDSLSGRTEIWAEGIEIFFDNPVTGVGLDSHREASSSGKEAHNTGISVLAETGIVGFLLLLNIIRVVVTRAWQREGWAKAYWLTQLAVVGLGTVSLSLEDSKAIWIFLALCVASAAAMQALRARLDSERSMLQPIQAPAVGVSDPGASG